jgi:hypothetical protein
VDYHLLFGGFILKVIIIKKVRLFLILLSIFLLSFKIKAQMDERFKYSKNSIDFLIFANRAFFNIVYNRTLKQNDKFSILISPEIGYTPGIDTSSGGVINLGIGPSLVYGRKFNKWILGVSYSGILEPGHLQNNPTNHRYVSGILGEIGDMRYFDVSSGLKLSFTPILIGNKYRQEISVPVGLAFRFLFK